MAADRLALALGGVADVLVERVEDGTSSVARPILRGVESGIESIVISSMHPSSSLPTPNETSLRLTLPRLVRGREGEQEASSFTGEMARGGPLTFWGLGPPSHPFRGLPGVLTSINSSRVHAECSVTSLLGFMSVQLKNVVTSPGFLGER